MFGRIGTGELVLILIIALIVVGPSKLPQLGRTLGKSISEFRKFSSDIKDDLSLDEKTKVAKVEKTEEKVEEVEQVEQVKDESTEDKQN